MRDLLREAARVSDLASPALIDGEPGSGKLTLAKAIHARSPAADGACTLVTGSRTGWRAAWRQAIAAPGGTVVLRRLGSLPPADQLGLADELDELVERGAGPRVLALATDGEDGIRPEFLHRLTQARLRVPPLRARGSDVHLIASAWCRRQAGAGRSAPVLTQDAREALAGHAWPGNIRELLAALESANVRHPGVIRSQDLQLARRGSEGAHAASQLSEIERQAILHALDEAGGNVSRAATILGISRSTLHRRLRTYRLVSPR